MDTIFHLLLNDELFGICCSAEQLVTALNSLGGANRREDVLLIRGSTWDSKWDLLFFAEISPPFAKRITNRFSKKNRQTALPIF